MSEEQIVAKSIECPAKGLGPVKLGEMSLEKVRELHKQLCPETERSEDKSKMVREILSAKRREQREKRRTKVLLEPVVEFPPEAAPAPEPAAEPAREPAETPVFEKGQTKLRVVSFNTLGLRMNDDESRDRWLAAAHELSEVADVIFLSELTPGALKINLPMFKDALGDGWGLIVSEGSAGGANGKKIEHHACLTKTPIFVSDNHTVKALQGARQDYGVFVVKLGGHQLTRGGKAVDVVISSVHMPPAKRAATRDAQLLKLLTLYPHQSALRHEVPFTVQGSKDARRQHAAHVIIGDFNRHPAELIEQRPSLAEQWRILVPRSCSTSAGGGSLDNIIISKDAQELLRVSWDVIRPRELANSRQSIKGISDHCALCIELSSF